MAQINRIHGVIAAVGLLAGLALIGVPAVAQTNTPVPNEDQGKSRMPDGMNSGGRTKPGMMMNPDMQQKMSRMMDNCNRMMESMIPNSDGAPTPPNKG
jgi:hypothetical protein